MNKLFARLSHRGLNLRLFFQTVFIIVLLVVTVARVAQAGSYTFWPLGFQNTACSGWERVTYSSRQTVTFTGAIAADESDQR